MNHYDKQQWYQYAEGNGPLPDRAMMEGHLYACDQCLDIFTACLDELAPELPAAMELDDEAFCGELMKRTVHVHRSQKRAQFRSTVLHYGIAAAATIILAAAGVFQGLTQGWEQIDARSSFQENTSVSDQIMNHTLTWIDHIQSQNDKGGLSP